MPISENKNAAFGLLTEPKHKGWRYLLITVAVWATALSQSFFVFGNIPEIPTETIYGFGIGIALFTLGIIYFNVYYLAPRYLPQREYANYLLLLIILVSGLVLAKGAGEFYLLAKAGIEKQWNAITLLDGLSNMVLYSICVASTSIGILFRQLLTDHSQIENLENKQLKNSIDEIKNRIQPAFLYATLDYTSQIVKSEPKHASDTLYKLSELLRYQLYDSTRNKVFLSSEIAFIRNYLLLHQQNSDGRFSFEIRTEGNNNRLITPSTFTPCIEELVGLNATKIVADFSFHGAKIEVNLVASGIDFDKNNDIETLQKLKSIYEPIRIEKKCSSLKIHLTIC